MQQCGHVLPAAHCSCAAQVPFSVVFTKADKEKKSRKAQAKASHGAGAGGTPGGVGRGTTANVNAFMQQLDAATAPGAPMPEAFVTSAAEGSGSRELLRHLAALRQAWLTEHGFAK